MFNNYLESKMGSSCMHVTGHVHALLHINAYMNCAMALSEF